MSKYVVVKTESATGFSTFLVVYVGGETSPLKKDRVISSYLHRKDAEGEAERLNIEITAHGGAYGG